MSKPNQHFTQTPKIINNS